ncbi:MAG TPA: hypothetical protein VFD70_18870, partial [Anaerolineae bacterium]|nr:hypothetical protein [Anaerolineae bacterium]
MDTLVAYHGDPEVKEKYLARVRAHRAADQIIHGAYWQGGKGCAVGCTIHGDDHSAYERELGIPRIIAKLEDRIFEGMSNSASLMFPERFLDAIPVGADLSMVWYKFAHWLLVDPEHGVICFANEKTRPAIEKVALLYQRKIEGHYIFEEEWKDAHRHAADAADAAYAAADAAYAAAYAAADA